jgi:hypothetical protein
MRPALFLSILLFAMPALAIDINGLPQPGTPIAAPADGIPDLADKLNETLFSNAAATPPMPTPPRANPNEPPLPPSPPPVTYTVWVYRWDGQQYVKQDDHTLQTMDIRKAASYWGQCNNYVGWKARSNAPDACSIHIVLHDPTITVAMGVPKPPPPDHLSFAIWAYKLTDGKWVKSDEFCWATQDPIQAWSYTRQINAVPGWYAGTNCPPILPNSQRYYEGGLAHGSPDRAYYYGSHGNIVWDATYCYYTYHHYYHR